MKVSKADSGAVVLAVFFATIFFFDAWPCAPASGMRVMSQNIVQASSSFQSLISTICWLVGFGFAVSGCVKIVRSLGLPVDDPRHAPAWRRGILHLFLGLGSISFPFVQQAFAPPYIPYGYGYNSARIIAQHDSDVKLMSILCWYFCLAFFLNGDLSLREALRLKDDPPAAARLKTKAAIYFLIGFALLAAPALYSLT
jgi:hypothetical protein